MLCNLETRNAKTNKKMFKNNLLHTYRVLQLVIARDLSGDERLGRSGVVRRQTAEIRARCIKAKSDYWGEREISSACLDAFKSIASYTCVARISYFFYPNHVHICKYFCKTGNSKGVSKSFCVS